MTYERGYFAKLVYNNKSRSDRTHCCCPAAAETAQQQPLVRDEFAAILVAAVNDPGWMVQPVCVNTNAASL